MLDACEHALADAAAPWCPRCRPSARASEVLATSRELHPRRRGAGDPQTAPSARSAGGRGADLPAVQLFAARARAARPGFELTPDAVPVAAEIARRLDGLPLAIEPAAARMKVLGSLSPARARRALASHCRDRSPSDPMSTALQGLVEWSYELLHRTDESVLLHQLAVH